MKKIYIYLMNKEEVEENHIFQTERRRKNFALHLNEGEKIN
jgi:hypothetical protein